MCLEKKDNNVFFEKRDKYAHAQYNWLMSVPYFFVSHKRPILYSTVAVEEVVNDGRQLMKMRRERKERLEL